MSDYFHCFGFFETGFHIAHTDLNPLIWMSRLLQCWDDRHPSCQEQQLPKLFLICQPLTQQLFQPIDFIF